MGGRNGWNESTQEGKAPIGFDRRIFGLSLPYVRVGKVRLIRTDGMSCLTVFMRRLTKAWFGGRSEEECSFQPFLRVAVVVYPIEGC